MRVCAKLLTSAPVDKSSWIIALSIHCPHHIAIVSLGVNFRRCIGASVCVYGGCTYVYTLAAGAADTLDLRFAAWFGPKVAANTIDHCVQHCESVTWTKGHKLCQHLKQLALSLSRSLSVSLYLFNWTETSWLKF